MLRLTAVAMAVLLVACSDASAGPGSEDEVVTANVQTSASFAGQLFPAVQLTISGSGTSSRGNAVSVSATTLDGAPVTSPVQVNEGIHSVCITATSSTSVSATTCRTVQLTWPRFQGRSALHGSQGSVTPPGLSLTVDDGAPFPITAPDGSFSIPHSKAATEGARLLFAGAGSVAPSLLRHVAGTAVNVVMLPTTLAIPSCSVYGGDVVPLDLEKAFAAASSGQTSFLDRTSSIRNTGKVVVASWNASSIPVALSDTGGTDKRFSPADSADVTSALATLTSYLCQRFHLTPVPVAVAGGVVVFKDPGFAALGAHSMALPPTRGDYTRADVVIRTLGAASSRDSTRRTVMHEFLHVLGFGHTCSWPSVMTTGTICPPSTYSAVPTRQDVAHYFAMQYARQGERALLTTESLGPAYVAALVAKGQPELQVLPYFRQP